MSLKLLAAAALALPSCAPAILHAGRDDGIAIAGEVPRDARGDPVWSAIRPMPAGAIPVTPGAVPAPVAEGSAP
jgi:hypothetical protein